MYPDDYDNVPNAYVHKRSEQQSKIKSICLAVNLNLAESTSSKPMKDTFEC